MTDAAPRRTSIADLFAAELKVHRAKQGKAAKDPAPTALKASLQPVLTLLESPIPFEIDDAVAGKRIWFATGPHPAPIARLAWKYGPITLMAGDESRVATYDKVAYAVPRDQRAENRARTRLTGAGFDTVGSVVYTSGPGGHDLVLLDPTPGAWLRFMLEELPGLRDAGWDIRIDESFPHKVADAAGADITFDLRQPTGTDWLDLNLGILVDGQRIDLAAALARRLASPEPMNPRPLLVALPDGRTLPIPFDRIAPILAPLLDLFESRPGQSGPIRVARHDAAALAALEAASAAAGIPWSGGDALRDLGRQLRDHGGVPAVQPPASFVAQLRTYQQQGVAWLQFLRTAGLGGVLADDMGLGKTVQALAHLAIEQHEGRLTNPALVVCPTSLVANWRAEAARFAPTLRTLVLHGPDRGDAFADIPDHDLVITTYPLLSRDHETLAVQSWHAVILDEAQIIKNPSAATSRLARTLRAGQRLCLSGTPLENHLGELWSLFDFLMPGFLGDRAGFTRRYRTPIEKNGKLDVQERLARRVAPFLLRRTKQAVATDLPPKTEITETIEMEAPQRAVYESIRLAMHNRVREAIESRGLARSGIVILDALLKLRQACCDPRLLKLPSTQTTKAGSAKLERLMELIPQMLEEGRRILLFSQFTSMLALVEQALQQSGQRYALLTGDTKDRSAAIELFQGGDVPLFLISLKAGGVGLNLTAADTVIHYDPWWNPAVEDQATDRAHRIGQDKPVFVHRLITVGTIEEKMEQLKARKQSLVSGILGSTGETSLALNEADLEALFAPD